MLIMECELSAKKMASHTHTLDKSRPREIVCPQIWLCYGGPQPTAFTQARTRRGARCMRSSLEHSVAGRLRSVHERIVAGMPCEFSQKPYGTNLRPQVKSLCKIVADPRRRPNQRTSPEHILPFPSHTVAFSTEGYYACV
ncbi:unnamed protein product [Toxocara canis]|uniref:Uncharacterized protein n=1 Tax=Toxocara canis TaxID=6265 RepID=A0A183V3G2_TOXCA|nr:unnamed protein product [Toxocara canis]